MSMPGARVLTSAQKRESFKHMPVVGYTPGYHEKPRIYCSKYACDLLRDDCLERIRRAKECGNICNPFHYTISQPNYSECLGCKLVESGNNNNNNSNNQVENSFNQTSPTTHTIPTKQDSSDQQETKEQQLPQQQPPNPPGHITITCPQCNGKRLARKGHSKRYSKDYTFLCLECRYPKNQEFVNLEGVTIKQLPGGQRSRWKRGTAIEVVICPECSAHFERYVSAKSKKRCPDCCSKNPSPRSKKRKVGRETTTTKEQIT